MTKGKGTKGTATLPWLKNTLIYNMGLAPNKETQKQLVSLWFPFKANNKWTSKGTTISTPEQNGWLPVWGLG